MKKKLSYNDLLKVGKNGLSEVNNYNPGHPMGDMITPDLMMMTQEQILEKYNYIESVKREKLERRLAAKSNVYVKEHNKIHKDMY